MRRFGRAVTALAGLVNDVVGHPVTFAAATVQTIVWTVVVLTTHLDPHGFWFLYVATAFSYVTQFTLTLVGLTAKREAGRAADDSRETLAAVLATMKATEALIVAVRAEEAARAEEMGVALEELHELLDDA
jgi:uncharacterized membrane protein